MAGSDLVSRIESARVDPDEFAARAAEEAEVIKDELAAGTFDNPQAIVGLEYELYGANVEDATLVRVPRDLLGLIGFEKELGLHNAEMHTSPQPLSGYGLTTQKTEVQARIDAAIDRTKNEGIRLISDGFWTIPPREKTAEEYLTDSETVDGTVVAANVSDDPRYQMMSDGGYEPAKRLDAPNVSLATATVAPESLTTSIQPHYQVPHAADLPQYFAYALRIAGPTLALGVNSPLFPPDLYDEGTTVEDVLREGRMENRIFAFETVLNPEDGDRKVRFPRDLESVEEAVDRIAADPPIVPMEVESGTRFDDEFAHFRHKHGSYWRWVRPVFEGASRSSANARIEFRPLPGQPTVRDAIGFLALFAGLMEGLPRRDHPLRELTWETARENFYAAARDGLDADLTWITADGRRTTDAGTAFEELFEYARIGLTLRGLSDVEAEAYLRPIRQRLTRGTTPAAWKRDRVADRAGEGATLAEAIRETQREYVRRQSETLLEGTFADWIGDPKLS